MADTLYIFDLMPFIHAGHVNKRSRLVRVEDVGSRLRQVVTLTGGTSQIFNALYDIVGTGDIVFCSDRRPTIKQSMFGAYKETRQHNPEIHKEKMTAEYILEKCGGTVLSYDGYEADDIIYTLVQKLRSRYNRIYIYTGDSDLYFLVDDKVSILPPHSRAKEITLENWCHTVIKDRYTPYNVLMISKIYGGDTSDNIYPLSPELQAEVRQWIFNEKFYPRLGNKEFVFEAFRLLVPDALHQAKLVFPLDVPNVPLVFSSMSIDAIRDWGDAINNKMFRGKSTGRFNVDPYVEELQVKFGLYTEEV